jgi:hypothetical protein
MSVLITIVMGIMRVVVSIIRIIVAVFTGDFGKVWDLIVGIGDIFMDTFSALGGFFLDWVDSILDFFSPVVDAIDYVVDGIGGVVGSIGGFLGFSQGGVARGPESGYPVTLHGTEAIVPLPDGQSIPVTIKGMGGGGGSTTYNANITVNGGGGNAREIAQQVSQEVQRAFRTRSRSSGFGRGVI